MSEPDTRDRLIVATLDVVREHGVRAVSVATVAAMAGLPETAVRAHFDGPDGVDELLAEACRAETARRVATYAGRFAAVRSMRELLLVGHELHTEEHATGNVVVLAQLLAASHASPTVRAATTDALRMWTKQIEPVLNRVLVGGPLDGLFDPPALAHVMAGTFIGVELFQTVDGSAADHALAELDRIGMLMEALDQLGPLARRAVRSRLGRVTRRSRYRAGYR